MATLQKQPSKQRPVLYLSNLPHSIASVQVEDIFHTLAHVEVHHVELMKKGLPGHVVKTCGLAAVTFNEGADLDRIIQLTDGHDMMGRPLIVRKDKFVEDSAAYVHVDAPHAAAAAAH
mmetsp:Transcript_31322/g.79907  ORF Transcript_31322/g.79907 Transcript_31322/m.79907 type:complete len:118 (-) Transcript_31322:1331-1684(-)